MSYSTTIDAAIAKLRGPVTPSRADLLMIAEALGPIRDFCARSERKAIDARYGRPRGVGASEVYKSEVTRGRRY